MVQDQHSLPTLLLHQSTPCTTIPIVLPVTIELVGTVDRVGGILFQREFYYLLQPT